MRLRSLRRQKKMKQKYKTLKKIIIVAVAVFVIAGFAKERFAAKEKDAGIGKGEDELESILGKSAPDFRFTDLEGNEYTKESLRGKKTVLFFNEGLACYPACWDEMVALSRDSRINNEGMVVLSVVVDRKESWENAIGKMPDLGEIKEAFDENGEASKAFGVLGLKSSMHAGVPGHTYVIIDREGVIRSVLDDPKMGNNVAKVFVELGRIN
ncbi:MAG: hypothetical protein UX75_C0004G0029 [Candidatus Moranbacteria bacterium GW2011_GWE2_47_10]|nr:MAG: hypothetical protein UX75_C0004G0029 [Candidatus Moranbacteria bacterium GW2011_GWE2_47_10]